VVVLPLVEGHGEMAAAPELIRKLCFELGGSTSRCGVGIARAEVGFLTHKNSVS